MHTCTVNDCARPIKNKTHGLCDPHYKRLWRHGDVQAHIPIPPSRKASVAVVDLPGGRRVCQECGETKTLDQFHLDARAPAGRRKSCKPCRTSREIDRYQADPERHRARMNTYRAENPERARAVDNARYLRHRDKRIAQAIDHSHRRRARLRGGEVDKGITMVALRKADGDECCFCGITMIFASFPAGSRPAEQATIEHILPISRGGTHTWDNVALSCWRDNISKGAATEGWVVRDSHRLSSSLAVGA